MITENDTFRSYAGKIKDIYDNWIKVTGEGTSVTLSPTRKGKMQVGVKGNTEQTQLTGKNLLPMLRTGTEEINGITYTINPDNSITINGKATADAYLPLMSENANNNLFTFPLLLFF